MIVLILHPILCIHLHLSPYASDGKNRLHPYETHRNHLPHLKTLKNQPTQRNLSLSSPSLYQINDIPILPPHKHIAVKRPHHSNITVIHLTCNIESSTIKPLRQLILTTMKSHIHIFKSSLEYSIRCNFHYLLLQKVPAHSTPKSFCSLPLSSAALNTKRKVLGILLQQYNVPNPEP